MIEEQGSVKALTPKLNSANIIFLGFCERATLVRDGPTNLLKWNILGLKSTIISYILPIPLKGSYMGFALDTNALESKFSLEIVDENGDKVGSLNFESQSISSKVDERAIKEGGVPLCIKEKGWTVVFTSLSSGDLLIRKPDKYFFILKSNRCDTIIGEFDLILIDPPPLTPERIAAIKSDPLSAKAVRMEFKCNTCNDYLRVYSALEPDDKLSEGGFLYYTDIPDEFTCSCGRAKIDLRIIRRNLHGLLGRRFVRGEDIIFTPMYERSALEKIVLDFKELLDSDPEEEVIQKFIQENPVVLHQFPAEKLMFKPPILTRFRADFGIVTPQKELILMEIERASTKLLRKDGGIHSDLNHAFDQVRNWLHVASEHRLAVLDALNIERSMVGKIKGVVIAGRDRGYDKQHLRRLKGTDFSNITFLTYDDLLNSLTSLIKNIEVT